MVQHLGSAPRPGYAGRVVPGHLGGMQQPLQRSERLIGCQRHALLDGDHTVGGEAGLGERGAIQRSPLGRVGTDDVGASRSLPVDADQSRGMRARGLRLQFSVRVIAARATRHANRERRPPCFQICPEPARSLAVANKPPPVMAFFFFSYARNDTQNEYLRSFYNELVVEISGRLGIKPNEAGFLDANLPSGSLWAEKTAQALATCKVFIPVYSPSFFNSGYCGQEWHCFRQRLAESKASNELILPVWWLPAGPQLPKCVASIQDPRDNHGKEFREHGLHLLRKVKRYRDDYEVFLTTFANQAIEAASRHDPIEGRIPNLVTSPNAFLGEPSEGTTCLVGDRPPGGGPKWARFIIVAGSQKQMGRYRSNIDCYGPEWDEWRPYYPDHDDPIGMHAQRLAGAQRLNSDLKVADGGLLKFVRDAEKRREIVLLLVDIWATKIDEYSTLLDEYDYEQFENAAVVVPENRTDSETAEHIDDLRGELFKCLRRSMLNNIQLFREDTGTVQAFEGAVQDVIVEVRRRIVDENPPERRAGPNDDDADPRPRIVGPGG